MLESSLNYNDLVQSPEIENVIAPLAEKYSCVSNSFAESGEVESRNGEDWMGDTKIVGDE